MKKLNLLKKILYHLYVKGKKSAHQIAVYLKCGKSTIYRYLKKYNIKIRNKSEYKDILAGSFKDGRSLKVNYCIDCLKKGIKTKIHWQAKRCLSCAAILRQSKRKNLHIIYNKERHIIHYCIKECGRKINYETWKHGQKRCKFCANKGKNHPGYIDGRTFNSYYCTDCNKIIGYGTAINGTGKCSFCATELRKGINSPNWRGGISKLPYAFEFNDELKEQIRKRDNYTCQHCGMTEEEHLIVTGKVLHVHHIDYNKLNCDNDNLISTCLCCNSRANFNRDYWKEFYQNILLIKETKNDNKF